MYLGFKRYQESDQIMKQFIIEVNSDNSKIVIEYLDSNGIFPSDKCSDEFKYIYYTGGLEYTTSPTYPKHLPSEWKSSFLEFYNRYINPKICRVVHHKKEEYDILICRPSKWGNPFSSKENSLAKYKAEDREDAIYKFEQWLTKGEGMHLLDDLHELKGKVLGCWCHPKRCHGDVLVKLVNKL